MSEPIEFFYDPRCPWAWRTSKWVRELEDKGIVTVEWRFFSLGVINEGAEDVMDNVEDTGTMALRTLARVKNIYGNETSAKLYEAMGNSSHEVPKRLTNKLVRAAVAETGLEPAIVDEALADDQTKKDVLHDHRAAVDGVGAFGVPTIVLESGRGIFGPVVDDEGADDPVELWTHVRWLIDKTGFYELKRERA
jgi:2-hydroxychromene-2-carboxylate isomerase